MTEKANPEHLYEKVASAIRTEVNEGRYAVGESIPSLRALAKSFEVGVPTVRQAIQLLANEGLLYTKPGSGIYVKNRVSSRHSQIALVLPDISNPFYAEITRAVETTCRKAGFQVMLFNTFYDENEESRVLADLIEQNIGGIIIAPIPEADNGETYRAVQRSGIPIVSIVRELNGVESSSVVTEDYNGVRDLLDYLIQIGHERIGYIASHPSNRRKVALQAYKDALKANGLEYRDEWVQMSALQGISGGKEAVIKMLAFTEKPTAIFACNDLTAIGALHGIRQIGLQVPEDIAVIGFDNIEVAEYLEVPLTTVGQPKTEMGKIGAKLIIDQIQGRSPELHKVSLQPKLIVRQSCGSLVMARRRAGA